MYGLRKDNETKAVPSTTTITHNQTLLTYLIFITTIDFYSIHSIFSEIESIDILNCITFMYYYYGNKNKEQQLF